MKYKPYLRGLAALVLATGCASASVPQERLIASQGSIRAAQEVGAEKIPAAALHLQLAQEQTEQAKPCKMQQGRRWQRHWRNRRVTH